jgi:hypothetical protein
MLAANYHAKNLDDMIPTHLNRAQQRALWHILKKYSVLFSGKLGKLPCTTNQFMPNSPIFGCRSDSYNNTTAHYSTILSTASD